MSANFVSTDLRMHRRTANAYDNDNDDDDDECPCFIS